MEGQKVYEGPCLGGPMDGKVGESRFPNGFLLADKATSRAWIYDWTGNSFVCRHSVALNFDSDKAVKAAIEDRYDVRALEVDDGSS